MYESRLTCITTVILLLTPIFTFAQVKTIAILPVLDKENTLSYGQKLTLQSSLTTEIVRAEDLTAYDRSDISSILSEMEFQNSGLVNDKDIKEIGRMTGVSYILLAEVVSIDESHSFVDVQILDVETAQVEACTNGVLNLSNISPQCKQIASSLLMMGNVSPMTQLKYAKSELQKFEDSKKIPNNVSNAYATFTKLAQYGNREACYYLSWIYYNGWHSIDRTPDYSQAIYWLNRTKPDDMMARLMRADCLYRRGLKDDKATAFAIYEDLAKEKNASYSFRNGQSVLAYALNALGICYLNGDGTKKDLAKAESLFNEAISLGNAEAYIGLGDTYNATSQIEKAASVWYLIASNSAFFPETRRYAAKQLFQRKIIAAPDLALMCAIIAAELGDCDCQYYLGIYYSRKETLNKDWSDFYYSVAASNGHKAAMEYVKNHNIKFYKNVEN